ncbi:Retrovirus-related Pol polyprotein from transposon TNT 1-94 [Cardamine amara subsp. amara]|uniref:Retrovirus-related Pol polyprotein from transposon TNT 1-94 n=1 Tax=Cardamine amara subsp. amara TaxID=228776 RepID=A0ABD1C6D0_CARAN
MAASYGDVMRKSDLEALIRSIAPLKESGTTLFASKPSKSLVIDSGASDHMISNSNLVDNIEPAMGNVIIASGDKIPVKGVGDLKLFDKNSKSFFMPMFTLSLLSVLRSDNEGEYTSHKFKEHLAKHVIMHQTSCPYTPQQNGVAERKNRPLMEVGRSMMFHRNVTKMF